jgi:hypothetical protein
VAGVLVVGRVLARAGPVAARLIGRVIDAATRLVVVFRLSRISSGSVAAGHGISILPEVPRMNANRDAGRGRDLRVRL